MTQALSLILSIVMWVLKRQPPLEEKYYQERMEDMDKAIAERNASNVTRLFGELHEEAARRGYGRTENKKTPEWYL